MPKLINLIGVRFSNLTVIKKSTPTDRRVNWECLCDCGKTTVVPAYKLFNGSSISCGCIKKVRKKSNKLIDLTGKIFGEWEVIGLDNNKNKNKKAKYWNCRCTICDKEKSVNGSALKIGASKHCTDHQKNLNLDISGKKIGELLILEPFFLRNEKFWNCSCSCGKFIDVSAKRLLWGKVKHCGHIKESDINLSQKKYREKNKEKEKKRKQIWYKKNAEKVTKHNSDWLKSVDGKLFRKKRYSRRAELGFNPLNSWFPGCEGHHINETDVIFIPAEVHKAIYHDLKTGNGMGEINDFAMKFLEKQRLEEEKCQTTKND